ncbi:MAG: hypothetical protein ACTSWC_02705 [Promethearchaeota archaeon]
MYHVTSKKQKLDSSCLTRVGFHSRIDAKCYPSNLFDGLAKSLNTILKLPTLLTFETAKEGESVTVIERVMLDFYIEGIRLSDEFFIAENLSEDVIIGAKTMQA